MRSAAARRFALRDDVAILRADPDDVKSEPMRSGQAEDADVPGTTGVILRRVLAFLPNIGAQEMVLLVVVGLLLYGRNLPEAGRGLGRAAAQLRRGWQEFKDQMDRDGDLREVKKTLQGTADELRRVADVPRAIADPRRAIQDAAREALSSEPPVETNPPVPPPPTEPRRDADVGDTTPGPGTPS